MTENWETAYGPARFLVENMDLLPGGRALDVAMGSGRNAIYLAENGFQVEGSKGSGLYPFPPFISRVLTKIVKHYSSGISIKVRKSMPNNKVS